jgi:DNA-binding transcriptional regulator YiaG
MAALDVLREQVQARRDLPRPAVRRALREAAGISRQALAASIDVSRESIRHWETGTVEPRGENLRLYLAALAVLQEGASAR